MALQVAVSTDVRGKRVLVIDDDYAVRTMLLVVLESAGYEVLGVPNGDEAMAVAIQWRPDLIVLDVLMPTRVGQEFLQCREAVPGLRSIPVIVVTAAAVRDVVTAEQLGVRAVVQKPHDVGVLRTLIEDSFLDTVDTVTGDCSALAEASGEAVTSDAPATISQARW